MKHWNIVSYNDPCFMYYILDLLCDASAIFEAAVCPVRTRVMK